ncbi:MAG: bifunctional phosphoribosylaminoimidazolecarboxamide formyltransferase/IMP cyclohydrolase PurH [Candidatus Dadabacteria bacterium]|nr:MAG: bifunctional phosphoribosylaminoimidazolecarboxamide formyltransferase/IMP cyclohydrolase PurH [Candidatus Dadabacteria bacterium]
MFYFGVGKIMEKAALLSVTDKNGLVELAEVLIECGFTLLASSGTGEYLKEHNIQTTSIERYTGQSEFLGGRVKTLHPKIHGGILARRNNEKDMLELEQNKIFPIDVAVVNLYPFSQRVSAGANMDQAVEVIDIGGPAMIRAAAKNFYYVLPVIDPGDYREVMEFLRSSSKIEHKQALEFRRRYAVKVFKELAEYNLNIAEYISSVTCVEGDKPEAFTFCCSSGNRFSQVGGLILEKAQDLRYGENPHQAAALYADKYKSWTQLNGKELSYNNLLDFDATLRIIRSVSGDKPFACIVKHLNPCGAACSEDCTDALKRAKASDPRSHFGGIIGFNQKVDLKAAKEVRADFAEIVLAPGYDDEALNYLQKSKNLRVVQFEPAAGSKYEVRSVEGGYLFQEIDSGVSSVKEARIVAGDGLSEQELLDLQFAWNLCAHVRSNAITVVKDQQLLAAGAGQMSRIDAARVALYKAEEHGHDLTGAVAASDAFFPFPDTIEALAHAGVKAIIAPGGSKRDDQVIKVACDLNITLLFSNDRHFRH